MCREILQEDPNLIEVVFVYEGNNYAELEDFYSFLSRRAREWSESHDDYERWSYLKNKFDGKAISMTGELFGEELQKVKEEKASGNKVRNSIGRPMNLKPETKEVVRNMLKDMNFFD